MLSAPANPTDRDLRWFGGLGMLFLWGVAGWLVVEQQAAAWAFAVAGLGLAAGLIGGMRPRLLRRIYIGWMWAVFPIGWLVGHLLLAITYFGVLTPVGWLLRWMGHDPLQRRPDLRAATFWKPRTRERNPADYFRQF